MQGEIVMGLIDTARQTLVELPISDILRERLSLAVDYAADLERKVSTLQSEVGNLQGQLERVTLDHNQCREQYQRLQKEHEEETRIWSTVEFRRGKRTDGQWVPFCPICHSPVSASVPHPLGQVACSGKCGWLSGIPSGKLGEIIQSFLKSH